MPITSSSNRSPWLGRLNLCILVVVALALYRRFSNTQPLLNLAPVTSARFPCDPLFDPVRRVAIIGAGSAGSSAAYYIHHYTQGCGRIDITVYERNNYVGGRSTTVQTYDDDERGEPVELGASIFVEVNQNLMHAVKKQALSTQGFQSKEKGYGDDGDEKELEDSIGVFDGQQMVYMSPRDPTGGWWMLARLLWRYGLAPIKTRGLMKETVGKFLKMYEAPVFPFGDLTGAVQQVGLEDVVAQAGLGYLRAGGVGDDFARDIIQASTRVNYAQNLENIHGLETMVCMATDGAMSVVGGNWQIFDGMLRYGQPNLLLNTSVDGITRNDDGTFTLSATQQGDAAATLEPATYDTIILAAPYQFANLTLTPQPALPIPSIPYVRLHVTLFTSPFALDPETFHLSPGNAVPRSVLTTTPAPIHDAPPGEGPWFYSVSTLRIVRHHITRKHEYLYKIFSPAPVEPSQFFEILDWKPDDYGEVPELVSWKYEKVWDSYPVEHPRVSFDQIKVPLEGDDDEAYIWYTSGIEPFISTMETSSLMGANVARLVVDEWLEDLASRSGPKPVESEDVASEL
ncbi:uncharacterized protein KY384_005722 [Bacidia gigantensis]|uniref:uncharacterized protein n=1 Tax=Bacidia gigantensis TaxID=2732470 RepID=UPI001D057FD5|nr:uncharacterized protein KY384_005722 [Bacidia gigantensis]KAG8529087.1 hypothetical protein KY384_005722 [Bacidia gigantensis]